MGKKPARVRMRVVSVAAVVVALGAIAGGTIAIASINDSEGGVTGPDADRAIQAALDAAGGGVAGVVERDDENGAAWEVEVTGVDGVTVDVRLNEDLELVTIEGDQEARDTDDAQAP